MAPEVSYSQLKANEWNTLALVYYPNTEDTTKLGYADFYLNGKYIETTDLSTLANIRANWYFILGRKVNK